jgi:uncharacterized hydrophobic protein (TIGR00271 family)
VPQLLAWPLRIAALRSDKARILLLGNGESTELDEDLRAHAPGIPTEVSTACDTQWGHEGWMVEDGEERLEGDERVRVTLAQIAADEIWDRLIDEANQGGHKLFCFGLPEGQPPKGEVRARWRRVLLELRCELAVIRLGRDRPESGPILVPAAHGAHARYALRLGADLTADDEGALEATYVEPELGVVAESVGRRILDRLGKAALGPRYTNTKSTVLISDDVATALSTRRLESGARAIILGASVRKAFSRQLTGPTSEKLVRSDEDSTVIIVRSSLPLVNRWQRLIEDVLQRSVPQIERDERLGMVERVQSNSMWDFDFSSLMCLATIIAAVGLVQNSAAVIIGAMLVAPLMTPMLGMGLALAQGNPRLVLAATRSIGLGMFTALVLAFIIGLFLPGFHDATPEMLARNWPGLLDLGVAFVSGLAAAYSSSRPNLLAALPGVAIAAALVPPIATAGLALSIWNHDLARGAMLLFITNMVAIVLASTMALWAVGVRGSKDGTRVTRYAGWGTLLSVLTLGVFLGLAAPEYHAPDPVPAQLIEDIEQHVAPSWRVIELIYDQASDPPELKIRLGGTDAPPPALAEELRQVVAQHVDHPVDVYLRTHWAMAAPHPGETEPEPLAEGEGSGDG